MDWMTGIQRAIDYVEEHLTEQIDYAEAAKRAYSSSFHFQRIFTALCGFTLGDYIRMRRLSLAGSELTEPGVKVIDVALKYGYDAPESFSRAFTKFHGVPPSKVKCGGTVKSFSRLSVKFILNGGITLDYRIETRAAFRLLVRKKRVPCKEELPAADITRFWQECREDGTVETLVRHTPKDSIFGDRIVGVSFGDDASEADFPYGIGTEYRGETVAETGLSVEEIPAHTYIVFPCVGEMPTAFEALYREIFTSFFPTSEYMPSSISFEAYPSADIADPNYTWELWIGVKKKD